MKDKKVVAKKEKDILDVYFVVVKTKDDKHRNVSIDTIINKVVGLSDKIYKVDKTNYTVLFQTDKKTYEQLFKAKLEKLADVNVDNLKMGYTAEGYTEKTPAVIPKSLEKFVRILELNYVNLTPIEMPQYDPKREI
jgi:hypothetical protein